MLNRVVEIILAFGVLISPINLLAKVVDDCECPVISCDACEQQTDVKFYSEKCGGGEKVKSCKKPICSAIEPAPQGCMSKSSNTKPKKVSKTQEVVLQKVSVVPPKKKKAHVGVVVVAKGKSFVFRTDEKKKKRIKVGSKIYERDLIETAKKGKVKILFKDKNTLNITPNTKIKIAEMKMEGTKEDRTMLDLMYGKIRSKVNKKYDGASNNYYRVRTKAAVAGVRGTDFVVSYQQDKNSNIETKVETITGIVALAPKRGKDDRGRLLNGPSEDRVEIPKGTYAKFVIDKDHVATDVFNSDDIDKFVSRGYLTPVYKLTAKELKILENETDFGEKRLVASDRDIASHQGSLCKAPGAPLNYCSWTCKNNPAGESRCRTDLPQVNCVRRRCNANGQWAEETRLPASFHDYCESSGSTVKACDY